MRYALPCLLILWLPLQAQQTRPSLRERERAHRTKAYEHYQKGALQAALTEYLAALELARASGHHQGVSSGHGAAAVIHRRLGQTDKAIAAHQAQIAVMRAHLGKRAEAGGQRSLAGCYLSIGKYALAVAGFQAAIQLSIEATDPAGEASARFGLGNAQSYAGQYDEALATLELARRRYERSGPVGKQMEVALHIGRVNRLAGKLAPARASVMRGLTLARVGRLMGGEAALRDQLARILILEAKYDEAAGQLQQSSRINALLRSRVGAAANEASRGELCKAQGKLALALAHQQKALAFHRRAPGQFHAMRIEVGRSAIQVLDQLGRQTEARALERELGLASK